CSDAGTPLVSDPGFELVRAAFDAEVPVVPLPGVSAVTAALSVSPLPVSRFLFEGFLPSKAAQRRSRLAHLCDLDVSIVCFESPRRLGEMLADVVEVMGDRRVFLAKEITKIHERFTAGTAATLRDVVAADPAYALGEYVVVIGAAERDGDALSGAARKLIRHLCDELPPSQAARIAARCLDVTKSQAYEFAMSLRPGPQQ
ncbi:MAG: rRNA (cytidine-2'-O-)-methyltransferase, partial [Gammaproteobacteria bacterium]|nr:rRNA (cytidine-2'-O-)-methyltransferase [Gammaproteobacteria bacterium]